MKWLLLNQARSLLPRGLVVAAGTGPIAAGADCPGFQWYTRMGSGSGSGLLGRHPSSLVPTSWLLWELEKAGEGSWKRDKKLEPVVSLINIARAFKLG